MDVAYKTTYTEAALPIGWTKLTHDSGLVLFLHKDTGVIAWSRPYVLPEAEGQSYEDRVRKHSPPLEIFAEGCGMKQPDANRNVKMVQADAIVRRLSEVARPQSDQTEFFEDKLGQDELFNRPSRKRPAPDSTSSEYNASPIRKEGSDRPRIIVGNGISVEDPAGKTAMAFLADYVHQSMNATPEYVQTTSDDPSMPYHCTVIIQGREFGHGIDTTKQLARQRAAEIALEAILPGYWENLKQSGVVREVTNYHPVNEQPTRTSVTTQEEFELMKMDDQRILQACMDLNIKTPAQLLTEFQTKHKGTAVNYITTSLPATEKNKFKVTASVGPQAADGYAGNKKNAKQFAALALLALLNPQVATYNELIRIHENSVKMHSESSNRAKIHKSGASAKFNNSAPQTPPMGAPAIGRPPREYGHHRQTHGYTAHEMYHPSPYTNPPLYSHYDPSQHSYTPGYSPSPTQYDYNYHAAPAPVSHSQAAWTYPQQQQHPPPRAPQQMSNPYPAQQTYPSNNSSNSNYRHPKSDLRKALNY